MGRFGYVDLIAWNERTGNLVGGHQRYDILVEEGVEEALMIVVDMSPEEELAANLTLNNPEIEGDWDDPIRELIERVQATNEALYNEAGFAQLQKAVENMVPPPVDDEPDTECPCCGHRWDIQDTNVKVMTKKEQFLLRNDS